MSETFLQKVTAETRERIAVARANGYLPKLRKRAEMAASQNESGRFRKAISRPDSINIIAEIKRASPSKGVIKTGVDAAKIAKLYAAGGAAAISVLTEPNHFDGSLSDLVSVARSVDLPILRKDFIVDEYQIIEAAAAGASAILLIVAALPVDGIRSLHQTAANFGLDVLVEVHDSREFDTAIDIEAEIIGVNNRDLHSLEVSLDTSRRVIQRRPDGVVVIAESGFTTRDEIDELRGLGYDGFLIGETLMRSPNLLETLRGLTT